MRRKMIWIQTTDSNVLPRFMQYTRLHLYSGILSLQGQATHTQDDTSHYPQMEVWLGILQGNAKGYMEDKKIKKRNHNTDSDKYLSDGDNIPSRSQDGRVEILLKTYWYLIQNRYNPEA